MNKKQAFKRVLNLINILIKIAKYLPHFHVLVLINLPTANAAPRIPEKTYQQAVNKVPNTH